MVNQLIQHKNELLNAAIYVDYENIFELLKGYGVNPLDIDFFPIILDKLKNEYDLDIIECITYGNFEKKSLDKHQTILHNLGIKTCHTANNGKNCGDLVLTVDTLTTLYKKPHINVFIIISSDRDMIPLLNAIKSENKITFMLSTKYGFNPVVTHYADCHEYIEDIFNLSPDMLIQEKVQSIEFFIKEDDFNHDDIENAKEVAKLLYSSNIWKTYETEGINPVTLKGYVKSISPKIGGGINQVIKYFELAHHYKYITIYNDQNKGLCIKKGDNYMEILGLIDFGG